MDYNRQDKRAAITGVHSSLFRRSTKQSDYEKLSVVSNLKLNC